ncbi:MAG TPA: Kdo hydroxylase family protein [Humisphaera sp.]|jgi:hypothetical protein|nr:Kdo hydroxylase family protein [Humisphaera sp.]
MSWIHITGFDRLNGWGSVADADDRARHYCGQLEAGKILYFDRAPFELPADQCEFLLSRKQSGLPIFKNVSYRPHTDLLRGVAKDEPRNIARLHEIMRDFSRRVISFADRFLLPYAGRRQIDYASFRPVEEQKRDLPLHKRNDLVHIDSFHTRPTNGGRILRIFVNINPRQNRVWQVTEPFEPLAHKLANDAGLGKYAAGAHSPMHKLRRTFAPIFRTIGVRGIDRSAYDQFMLHFHDWLKESRDYQEKTAKERLEFPPYSAWMVYTDTVPHAVVSGQFALEQTLIVPIEAMVVPRVSPLRLLEAMCGTALAN